MAEFLIEFVVRLLIRAFVFGIILVPATIAVFVYQLVVRRSFLEAARIAGQVAYDILTKSAVSEAPWASRP